MGLVLLLAWALAWGVSADAQAYQAPSSKAPSTAPPKSGAGGGYGKQGGKKSGKAWVAPPRNDVKKKAAGKYGGANKSPWKGKSGKPGPKYSSSKPSPFAALEASAKPQGAATPTLPPPWTVAKPKRLVMVTPRSIQVEGGAVVAAENSIVRALEVCGPGSTIVLDAGDYRPFSIGFSKEDPNNARTRGGAPGQPIVVAARGAVRIHGGAFGHCIRIAQQVPNGYVTFRGIALHGATQSAIRLERGSTHVGFRFEDCPIDGGYDHAARQGLASNLGIDAYGVIDFAYVGTKQPVAIAHLRNGDGIRLANTQGDVVIERVVGERLGGAFVRITAASTDGPPGLGLVVLRHCVARDVGLNPDANHKSAYAYTITGRHFGTIALDRCEYRSGFDAALLGLTQPGVAYGLGAVQVTDGVDHARTETLVVYGCDFQAAPETGAAPLVSIGGVHMLRIEGKSTFVAGRSGLALDLDPRAVDAAGGLRSTANGLTRIAQDTVLKGASRVRGVDVKLEQLANYGAR
ncbi:MAG: hypothetical protein IPH13_03145 [Planctomycetes bacterium]|nr:hypothetical protein [Planctomycetota bacterium]MCC7173437.1 hypothetical protein [Planctomycetota bacterium]